MRRELAPLRGRCQPPLQWRMRSVPRVCGFAGALLALSSIAPDPYVCGQAIHPHHEFEILLDPASPRLVVTDELTLPPGLPRLEFLLNARLRITKSSGPVNEVPLGDTTPFFVGLT